MVLWASLFKNLCLLWHSLGFSSRPPKGDRHYYSASFIINP
ncbi:hypothetical protein [Picosynechococcus sp. PCC 7002]|nr:hypothetical protein [Picosynechococcus sp. PCC 7002]